MTAKWLTKQQMKLIRGGIGPSKNLCGDNEVHTCTVTKDGVTLSGECTSMNGRCKCSTSFGDYQTANDHYSCEDMLPATTLVS
jgi:hypothetical protein